MTHMLSSTLSTPNLIELDLALIAVSDLPWGDETRTYNLVIMAHEVALNGGIGDAVTYLDRAAKHTRDRKVRKAVKVALLALQDWGWAMSEIIS